MKHIPLFNHLCFYSCCLCSCFLPVKSLTFELKIGIPDFSISYVIYLNNYCYQAFQRGDLLREAPTVKLRWAFNQVILWFWFSLIWFVGLKCKHPNRYQLLAYHVTTTTFSATSTYDNFYILVPISWRMKFECLAPFNLICYS